MFCLLSMSPLHNSLAKFLLWAYFAFKPLTLLFKERHILINR